MLISHDRRFIYLKTVKTAGTSIEIYFERYCTEPSDRQESHERGAEVSRRGVVGYRGASPEGQTWYNHMPAAAVKALVPAETWDEYLKFCAVRDPFDKVVSWFWFALSEAERDTLRREPFAAVRSAFGEWLGKRDLPADRDVFCVDDELVVDEIVRYESLNDDLAAICATLGVPWEPQRLGRYKGEYRARPEHFSLYYDEGSTAIVAQAYAWELERFGYSLPLTTG